MLNLSRDFILWLDGYLENVPEGFDLNKEKTAKIKDRLNKVFKHEIDPEQDKGRNAKELRQIHSGTESPGSYDPFQRDMC
jgi:hypothetical protein